MSDRERVTSSIEATAAPERATSHGKIMSARQAATLIASGDTVASAGFVGIGFAESIAIALEARFVEGAASHADAVGTPRGLTLVFGSSQGDFKERGLNRFAHRGMVSRVIGGHFGAVPKLQRLILANEIEAYNLPQGVVTHLYRDIAAGRPAHLTHIGLDTFADPRHGGGKLNERTTEDLVRLIEIDSAEALLYRTFPIHVAILRGTTADPDGNVTMEREALTLEALSLAMAARNSGGIVIVQVERLAEPRSLNARQVKIPGILVDAVVVAEKPADHMQTFGEPYSAAFASEVKVAVSTLIPMPFGLRKVVARRAALELTPQAVINLGIGMPEGIASVAAEAGVIGQLTLTAEPGVIGGIPATGLNFGAAVNADSIIDQPYQFDFYDGGGIDQSFLGMAEVDSEGNVNVSRFGQRVPGAGGFVNIARNTKSLVFVGTFTAGGLEVEIEAGRLSIRKEGRHRKFVGLVAHRTFSGSQAIKRRQPVLFVTERCVFRLTPEGLELTEIAPGIDLARDILQQMDFAPIVRHPVAMNPAVFSPNAVNFLTRFKKSVASARRDAADSTLAPLTGHP